MQPSAQPSSQPSMQPSLQLLSDHRISNHHSRHYNQVAIQHRSHLSNQAQIQLGNRRYNLPGIRPVNQVRNHLINL
jgi:hypothetical protein